MRRARRGRARAAGRGARAAPSAPRRTRTCRRRGRVQSERLLAEPVAGEHEPLARAVPERDREHPLEALDEAGPVLLVQCGITGVSPRPRTSWPRAASSSRRAREVVQLPVEDGDHVAASRWRPAGSRAPGRRPRAAGGRGRRLRRRRSSPRRDRGAGSGRASRRRAPAAAVATANRVRKSRTRAT